MVAALARTGDPDLAVRSLHRLVEALDSADATGASPRRCWRACAARPCCAGGCSRCSARAPAWPTTSPPTQRLDGPGRRRRRASRRRGRTVGARARAPDARGDRRRSRRPALGRAPGQGGAGRVAGAHRRPPAGLPPVDPVAGRPRPRRRAAGRGRRRRARRHRGRRPDRRPGAGRRRAADVRRALPPGGHRHGQDAAGGSSTTSATSTSSSSPSRSIPSDPESPAISVGDAGRRGPHADLPGGGLGGRRRAAPRGQGRRARAHPRRPPGLLRAVGQHLGVPGAAQDASGRRGSATSAAPTSRRSGRWCGRPATGPGSSARCRPCAGGSRRTSRRPRPSGSSSSGAAACATSSSPSSCCRWCTAGPTLPLRVGGTLPALHAAVGRRLRRPGRRRDADRLLPVPAHRRAPAAAAPAAPHAPAAHRRAAAALAGPLAGLQARRAGRAPSTCCGPSWTCTPARCAGCTRSSSTVRCSRRWRACRASSCNSARRRPGTGCGHSASPTRMRRCGTSRRSPAGSRGRPRCRSTCCPVLLQTFASCPNPDAGLLAYRQVSEALGGNQWFLRLLRDEGQVAERLAQLLGSSQYVAVAAHAHAGGAADPGRRQPSSSRASAAALAGAWRPGGRSRARSAGRHPGAARAAPAGAAARGRRRSAGPAGRRPGRARAHRHRRGHPAGGPGRRPAGVRRGGRHRPGRHPHGPRGHRHGPARRRRDGLRVRRRRPLRAPAAGGRRREPGDRGRERRRAHAAPAAQRARARPRLRGGRRPAARGTAGRPGPQPVGVPRVLRALGLGLGGAGAAARGAGRRRRGARRGLRRDDRPDPLPRRRADRGAGRRDPPDQGAGGAGAAAPRRGPGDPHQARPRRSGRRRVDRAAAPAAARRRRPGTAGALDGRGAGRRSGRPSCWTPSRPRPCGRRGSSRPRARNAIFLVRGRPSDQLPRPGLELAGVARACGYGPDMDPGQFLDDYRRTSRHARPSSSASSTGRPPPAERAARQGLAGPRPPEHAGRGPHRGSRTAARGSGCGPSRRSACHPRSPARSPPSSSAPPLLVFLAVGSAVAGIDDDRRVRRGVRLRPDPAGAGLRHRPDLGLPRQSRGHPRGAASPRA